MSEELNQLLTKIEAQLVLKGITPKRYYLTNPNLLTSFNKDQSQKEAEQKVLQETTNPYNFYTPLLTIKSKNDMPMQMGFTNQTAPTTQTNLNTSIDYETHKIIERELEPYLNSVRKELRISFDTLQKEMGEYKTNQSEIITLKEITSNNRRIIGQLQNDIEIKAQENKEDIFKLSSELNKKNQEINDLRGNIQYLNDKIEEMEKTIRHLVKKDNDSNDNKIDKAKIIEEIDEKINEKISNSEQVMINNLKEIEKSTTSNLVKMGEFLQKSSTESKNDINQIKEEIKKLKTSTEYNSDNLEKMIKTLKSQCEEDKEEQNKLNENFEQKIIDIQSEPKTSPHIIGEIPSMSNNNVDYSKNIEEMNYQISQLSTKIEDLSNSTNLTLQQKNDALILKIENISQGYSNLQDMCKDNQNKISVLEEEKSKLESNLILLERKIADSNNNIEMLEEKMNQKEQIEPKEQIIPIQDNNYKKDIEELNSKVNGIYTNLEEINNNFNQQLSNTYALFAEFKEKQLQANEINEKTIVCLGDQMVSSLKILKNLENDKEENEDNFEKIQDGFDNIQNIIIKIPKLEKDYKLLNEFVVELTKKYQELQIEVNSGFEGVTKWEAGLVDNISKKMNEIIEDYERKISQTSQRIQSSRDATAPPGKSEESNTNNIQVQPITKNIDDFDFDNHNNDDKNVFGSNQDWDFSDNK